MTARRVLLIGEFEDGALARCYERALVGAGWEASRYDAWAGYARRPWLARNRALRRALRPWLWRMMSSEALGRAREAHPRLVLVTKGAFLSAEDVRKLRRVTGAPVVNIYPDDPYGPWAQRRDARGPLRVFTRVYVWSRALVARLAADGVPSPSYLPFAHDPDCYRPGLESPTTACGRRHAVVFVGQWLPKREQWLAALADLDLGIWGPGWHGRALPQQPGVCLHGEPVVGRHVGGIYGTGRVAINVLNPQNAGAHNMRTFEIPPCGTVMATEASPDIHSFFPSGVACVSGATPEALHQEILEVLRDPDRAETIAERALGLGRPHTYARRAREVLEDLGLQGAGVRATG